ncbi:unnamed protein product [Lampetra fluviatilis]
MSYGDAPDGLASALGLEASEEDATPLREQPLRLEEKKRIVALLARDAPLLSQWESWRRSMSTRMRRSRAGAHGALKSTALWSGSLKEIAGRFGSAIQSYFSFMRFLVLLNVCLFLIMFSFVVIPNIVNEHLGVATTPASTATNSTSNKCLVYNLPQRPLGYFYEYVLDALSGTGFLEKTYLFYGFYPSTTVGSQQSAYSLPLAYLLSSIAVLLVSLLWVVRRSAQGWKLGTLQSEASGLHYSPQVFSGWDHSLRDANSATLKHSSLAYQLVTDLGEERSRRRIAERTRAQKARVYVVRVLLNVLVLALLGAAFYCIYWATTYSQGYTPGKLKAGSIQGGVDFLVQYLPSIVITLANFLLPLVFGMTIVWEDYSPGFEIRLSLLRYVSLRLASVAVLLVTLWSRITCDNNNKISVANSNSSSSDCQQCGYNKDYPCWETRVGQEMYKLTIFDLITSLVSILLVEFPRKMIVTHCGCGLTRWIGEQEFSIPDQVLHIVYGQTVCWVGTIYCPLLPLLAAIKYTIFFYSKKLSLMLNCRPASRPYRASSSMFFFFIVLLLGLLLAWVPAIYTIGGIRPSQACGPFQGQRLPWTELVTAVQALPQWLDSILEFFASLLFAIILVLLSSLFLFYMTTLNNAHARVINQLRDELAMVGRDRAFLAKQVNATSKGGGDAGRHRMARGGGRTSCLGGVINLAYQRHGDQGGLPQGARVGTGSPAGDVVGRAGVRYAEGDASLPGTPAPSENPY